MDPEKNFVITEDNKKRIKELLVNLQREKLLEETQNNSNINSVDGSVNNATYTRVLETFTNLLFEALQFV